MEQIKPEDMWTDDHKDYKLIKKTQDHLLYQLKQ